MSLPRNVILPGDATERLRELPSASVDCIITSPPYFNLRYYGAEPDQLGLEETVDEYVAAIAAVCGELARVLKPAGALWLNVGDSYSRARSWGAAPKSLLLAPERLLLALTREAWIPRNRVTWSKQNPMPESVRDRLSATHEDVFFLTRRGRYFFDLDAIRAPHTSRPIKRRTPTVPQVPLGPRDHLHDGMARMQLEGRVGHPNGKNPGTVWSLPTASYRGAHFATFPESLVERPILATCPERLCARCGTPWAATYRREGEALRRTAYRPACRCRADWLPGVVLDPFFGAGTVGVVAERLRRDWLGIELNAEYRALASERLKAAKPDPGGANGRPC